MLYIIIFIICWLTIYSLVPKNYKLKPKNTMIIPVKAIITLWTILATIVLSLMAWLFLISGNDTSSIGVKDLSSDIPKDKLFIKKAPKSQDYIVYVEEKDKSLTALSGASYMRDSVSAKDTKSNVVSVKFTSHKNKFVEKNKFDLTKNYWTGRVKVYTTSKKTFSEPIEVHIPLNMKDTGNEYIPVGNVIVDNSK